MLETEEAAVCLHVSTDILGQYIFLIPPTLRKAEIEMCFQPFKTKYKATDLNQISDKLLTLFLIS